jgi:hypothetical protein
MAELTKIIDNTNNQRLPQLQKNEFYCLGKETKNPSIQINHNNKGFAVILLLYRTPLQIFMKEIT